MPVFNNTEIKVDFDGLSRDVVTLGLKMVTRGFETGFHSHRKAQCVMAVSGVLTCEAEGGIWIVAPRRPTGYLPESSTASPLLAMSKATTRSSSPPPRRPSLKVLLDLRHVAAARTHGSHRQSPTDTRRRWDGVAGGGSIARRNLDFRGGSNCVFRCRGTSGCARIFQSFMKTPLTEGRSRPRRGDVGGFRRSYLVEVECA